MKTIVTILVVLLVLSSCVTRQEKENLCASWYQYTLLAADSTGKVDTVYIDGMTADRIAEIPLTAGDLIEVQKTSIGYVYSTHEYLTKDIYKTYLGIWEEIYKEILPIQKKHFKQILHGTTVDPMHKILNEEMENMMPR